MRFFSRISRYRNRSIVKSIKCKSATPAREKQSQTGAMSIRRRSIRRVQFVATQFVAHSIRRYSIRRTFNSSHSFRRML